MEIKKGASVIASDGKKVGEVDRIVIDPRNQIASHIVLRRGLIPEEKVIPMDMIQPEEDKDQNIHLAGTSEAVDNAPNFEETHFIWTDETDVDRIETGAEKRTNVYRAPLLYWYPPVIGGAGLTAPGTAAAPYLIPDTGAPNYVAEVEQHIPEGTVAVREGATVISSDDHEVGNVERVYVREEDQHVTHILVSKGLIVKEKKLIPIHWVADVTEDGIRLAVKEAYLDRLPDYQGD